MSDTYVPDKRDEATLSAIGGITDVRILERMARKVRRQLKSLGVDVRPGSGPKISIKDINPGDEAVIGTANGQHTRVKVVTVNRKRVKVELLEERGTRKPMDPGTVVDVYPELIRSVTSPDSSTSVTDCQPMPNQVATMPANK